jgi:solute:Na+ symporter, SSS family
MNALDYAVLLGTMLGIAAYGTWRTRGRQDLATYLKGSGKASWLVIGLSVMATQASAVTFLSTPGQGYESGLSFVQNYFGAPFALILISAVFLPLYRRLNVYTAYEFLGRRFDSKTRVLGAGLFLLQRGLQAGITIYAPAIVLSTVLGWRLDATIVASGLVVTAYTVAGGSIAVSITQMYQFGVILAGMAVAFFVLLARLPETLTMTDALTVAGGFHRLEAVDFSLDPERRYTFWTGMFGGMFLALSYFGTDQSQVQRYIGGASLRESRLGLMFNAVFKIPMQFFILLLGALIFVFYVFQPAPLFFNAASWKHLLDTNPSESVHALESEFDTAHAARLKHVEAWLTAVHAGDTEAAASAKKAALEAHASGEKIRSEASSAIKAAKLQRTGSDIDYVFITFILQQLPHGIIGLLVAVFFAATLSSKAGELNALASSTIVDFYRHLVKKQASDAHYVTASRWFTVFWGLVAIAFALFANLVENLVQAVNIVGSLFYGVVLGIFLVAFFLRQIGGTAVFWSALASQATVLILYALLSISYLWYNVIGCALCMVLSVCLHYTLNPPLKQASA